MDERITNVTADLAAAVTDAKESFGGLTVEQLNWKPAENSWSVAQCLDHLIKTNHEFDAEFEKLMAGGRKNSFWENYSPLTGWCGRFLVNAARNDSKKIKAPSKRIVPPSDISGDIVERFVDDFASMNQKVKACAGLDRKTTVLTSPFLKVMTYTLDDALSLLVEHTRRHIRQAKRVTEMPAFRLTDS